MPVGDIKVTDRRMFTPDGRVREDYVAGDEPDAEAAAPAKAAGPAPDFGADFGAAVPEPRSVAEVPQDNAAAAPRLELPGTSPGTGPSFLDLVGLLTDPIPFYLGDEALPDGQSVENLDAARLHIDLLDVLHKRTAGNLTAQEQTVLEDLLYRLRVRYVHKRG